MKRNFFAQAWCCLAAAAVAMATTVVIAQTPVNDEAAVREAVGHYFRGMKFNDVESLKKVFWPEAKLSFVKKDGQLGQLSQTQWYEGFAASAGKEEKVDLRVVSLDISGDAAQVKVEEEYPKSLYTNYLSLLKIGGEWKIVNKIYTVRRKSS